MQSGRPRREDEKPDSPFGEALKEHLRRVKNFTQTDLARETRIPEKTLSHMVKGRRTSGTWLRRDLRDIIKVLYHKRALLTLEEANRLNHCLVQRTSSQNRTSYLHSRAHTKYSSQQCGCRSHATFRRRYLD